MDAIKETGKKYQAIWLKYTVFMLVCWVVGVVLEKTALANFADRDWYDLAMTVIVFYVVGFIVLLLITKNTRAVPPERAKAGFGWLISALLIAMLFADIGTLVSLPVKAAVHGGNALTASAATTMIIDGNPIWSFLLAVILGPIFEELIFRKLLIDRVYKYGELAAILASALAFGLYHRNVDQMFYTFAMALVFAYVYVRTGNIFCTIGLHIVNNLFSFLLASSVNMIDMDAITQAAQAGTELSAEVAASIFPAVFMLLLKGLLDVVALILLIISIKKKKIYTQETTEQLPKGKGRIAFVNIGFLAYAVVCIASYYIAI